MGPVASRNGQLIALFFFRRNPLKALTRFPDEHGAIRGISLQGFLLRCSKVENGPERLNPGQRYLPRSVSPCSEMVSDLSRPTPLPSVLEKKEIRLSFASSSELGLPVISSSFSSGGFYRPQKCSVKGA